MEREEYPREEYFVFLLQWQGEAIDDRTKNFKQLGYTIESLGLVDELEEHIVDGAPNVRPKVEEFAVDPVQSCFEEIPFSGVFGIEKIKQLKQQRRKRGAISDCSSVYSR